MTLIYSCIRLSAFYLFHVVLLHFKNVIIIGNTRA